MANNVYQRNAPVVLSNLAKANKMENEAARLVKAAEANEMRRADLLKKCDALMARADDLLDMADAMRANNRSC